MGQVSSPNKIKEYTELFKEFCDIFTWSYKEMPGIDPRIVEHEIKTYPNTKTVQQHLHAVNPRKTPTIKAEIEKLLKVGFIYLVPFTEWVSNPVLVDKKQGVIHIFTDFRDLNCAYIKDNIPTQIIHQILVVCRK